MNAAKPYTKAATGSTGPKHGMESHARFMLPLSGDRAGGLSDLTCNVLCRGSSRSGPTLCVGCRSSTTANSCPESIIAPSTCFATAQRPLIILEKALLMHRPTLTSGHSLRPRYPLLPMSMAKGPCLITILNVRPRPLFRLGQADVVVLIGLA